MTNYLTVGLFWITIFGFGIFSISNWHISSRTNCIEENRRYNAFPHLRPQLQFVTEFPSGFEKFYNDRFALRHELIRTLNECQYKVFAVSSSKMVLIGKNNWLFLLYAGDREVLRHSPLFSKEELATWVKTLEARRIWLANRHIKYLFFLVPSKCEIYHELVPSQYKRENKYSRQDELLAALRAHSQVPVLDLRPILIAAKKQFQEPLYYKTDTHWNELGSFIAYRYVAHYLTALYPDIKVISFDNVKIRPCDFDRGDLAGFMDLEGFLKEITVKVDYKHDFEWQRRSDLPKPDSGDEDSYAWPFATTIPHSKLPRAFIIRDSFLTVNWRFFANNFSNCYYYWGRKFPVKEIEKEQPDILIQELTERDLCATSLINPPEVDSLAK